MKDGIEVSVVVPAYREADRLGATLDVMLDYLQRQPWQSEIIIIDDGSDDATAAVAESHGSSRVPVRVLRHSQNRGKGAAVKTGMLEARGKYALFADADNATPFEELGELLPMAHKGDDIVMGSRYLAGSKVVKKQPLFRRFMSRAGNLLFRILLGLRYTDTRCGFKLFSRKAREIVFTRQSLDRWGFDTELLVIAGVHGLRVREVPVRWHDRERGNIHPLRDSLRSLKEIAHIRARLRHGLYD